MTDVETLEERVSTVERAVTDGDHGFPAVDDLAELTERVDALEDRVDELNDRADELDAATQALRGYVGNVRSVNERVEGRADAALAATERLERRLDATTEEWRPGDGEPVGSSTTRDPSEHAQEDHHSGGVKTGERRLDGLETRDGGEKSGESGTPATDGGDAGVLEQIRSLL
ncbi:DUF7310 family coiled-coil domain-containing protein [Haloarcula laminariae]|uniref:DUF7310 family coiled-coil domain-containing protein n=1 Tax=Haloarcula laminariae TaxID=2961577 RepID=UPI002405933B|nr:hypothetical protein [Halomicroarcula sp. FL173]